MTNEVQKPDRQAALVKTAWELLKDQKKNIADVLPKHITADRMAMIAFTAMRRNPKLLECSRDSLIGSLLTAAMLGLEPSGPLGHGALIPYWNSNLYSRGKGGYECQFQPMYQGMLDLARRSGFIRDVQLRAVFEGDTYSYRFGLEPDITHVPLEGKGADDPDRRPTHVYCVIRFTNGGVQWDQMSMEQGLAHGMKYSPSWDRSVKAFKPGSVWATDPVAMVQKTILKRVLKLCPKSPELAAALTLDETQDAGKSAYLERVGDGAFDLLTDGEQQSAPPADPVEKDPNRGVLDINAFRAGKEDNRGHGQEDLERVKEQTAPPPAQAALEQQLTDSMIRCEASDFAEIEAIALGAGLSVQGRGGVAEHVMVTMGFPEYMQLTKGRKPEVLAWIKAKGRK